MFQLPVACIQNRAIAAGVQLEQDRPGSGVGKIDCNNEAWRERQDGLRVFRRHQRNPFAAKVFFHNLGLVETEQSARIVDEHIEMGEKVLSEDAPNPWICRLNRLQILYDDEWLQHHM